MHAARSLYQLYTFIISHVSFHSSGIATKQRTCVIQSSRRRRASCNQRRGAICARVPSLFCQAIGAEPLLLPESYIWCKFNHTTDCTLIRRVASRDLILFGAQPPRGAHYPPDATWTHSQQSSSYSLQKAASRERWCSLPASRLRVIKPAAAEASFPSPLCRALRRKRKFHQKKEIEIYFVEKLAPVSRLLSLLTRHKKVEILIKIFLRRCEFANSSRWGKELKKC